MPPTPGPEPIETRIGIITGWRCWTVLENEALLRPIWRRGLIWKPRQPYEAFCADEGRDTSSRVAIHEVPEPSCKCGIWAVCHPMLLEEVDWEWNADEVVVVGQVALWGNVIEFKRGWRSQFGYPVHLYAFTNVELLAQTLRERYGVPVAWGAEADLLRSILPKSFAPRGQVTAGVVPQVPAAMAIPMGEGAMVQSQEAQRLEQLRAEAQLEQERLQKTQERLQKTHEAYRQERERLKEEIRHEQECLRAERQALRLERQRRELEIQRRAVQKERGIPRRDPLSNEIKRLLAENGVTQDQVAAAAGVGRSCVAHVLAGRAKSRNVVDVAPRYIWIHSKLRDLGWSQNELARRIGKGPGLISRVLRGQVTSSIVWERIEQVLSTPLTRKPLAKIERREERVTVRLTPTQRAVFDAAARAAGTEISGYIRDCAVMGHTMKQTQAAAQAQKKPQLRRQLKGLGHGPA